MNCDECQTWISEALDGARSAQDRTAVEQHVTACPACQQFQRTLLTLEPQLAQQASRAELPEGFRAAVMARMPADPRRLTTEEIAVRRAEFEHEHREALAALERRFWPWRLVTWLQPLAMVAACAGGAWLLVTMADSVLNALASVSLGWGGVTASSAVSWALALAVVVWSWKRRSWHWRFPRSFLATVRPLRL